MSLIKKPNELPVKKTIVGGIYGIPSGGKSTLALSMPKPLLIDFDRGLHRVDAQYRCDSVPVETYAEVLEVLEEDLSAYETIVIDTLGKCVDAMMEETLQEYPTYLQKDKTPSTRAWGIVKNKFVSLRKKLERLNKNLIFVAHAVEKTVDDNIVIRPDVSGSAGKDIIKEFDFMGYIEIIGNKRTINFAPTSKYYAKNSLHLDNYVNIPILEEGDKNTFLTDYILNPTVEKRKAEFGNKDKYNEVLAQAKAIIAEKGKTDEAKALLRKLPKIGDSHEQIAKMLGVDKKDE